jgi:hypothetical protein
MAKRRRNGLSAAEEQALLRDFEREASRARRKKPQAVRRNAASPARKTKPRPKPKPKPRVRKPKTKTSRSRTRIKSFKYGQNYTAKEVKNALGKAIVFRHDSETYELANKIYSKLEGEFQFRKNSTRRVGIRIGWREKYKRRNRYFSTVMQDVESQADLFDLCVKAADDIKEAIVRYEMRGMRIRITEVNTAEYV